MRRWLLLITVIPVFACGGGGGRSDQPDASLGPDDDGDGYTVAQGDCNDHDATIHPGAPDPCDGVDNNCNGMIDENYDMDHDGFTTCNGDCADNDPTSYPGATEVVDGRDNDCDGIVDNHTNSYDDDGDGYTEDQGDCNDNDPLVNPGAIEVQYMSDGVTPEGVDNNCNGLIDEPPTPCLTDPTASPDDALNFARSIGICDHIVSAEFASPTDPRARHIITDFGTVYVPRDGADMGVLSTGLAVDENTPGWVIPQPGTNLGDSDTAPHPNPAGPDACSPSGDPPTVNDLAELRIVLQVPTNAKSFSYDFNFMSAEYPEFHCTSFDDTFEALLTSSTITGNPNISFDTMGNPVSINVGFFTTCQAGSEPMGTPPGTCMNYGDLAGTGFEGDTGGGTGWLTTTAPVAPGEKITLRFVIWDEGDHIYDSTVLLDNFHWKLTPVDHPTTIP
jgi:hypothetical protein